MTKLNSLYSFLSHSFTPLLEIVTILLWLLCNFIISIKQLTNIPGTSLNSLRYQLIGTLWQSCLFFRRKIWGTDWWSGLPWLSQRVSGGARDWNPCLEQMGTLNRALLLSFLGHTLHFPLCAQEWLLVGLRDRKGPGDWTQPRHV